MRYDRIGLAMIRAATLLPRIKKFNARTPFLAFVLTARYATGNGYLSMSARLLKACGLSSMDEFAHRFRGMSADEMAMLVTLSASPEWDRQDG